MNDLEGRVRNIEHTIATEFSAIKTTIRNFSVFISILGMLVLFMLTIVGWEFNRIISYNDNIDNAQSQSIVDIRLEYTKAINNITNKVDHLENIINTHFKRN